MWIGSEPSSDLKLIGDDIEAKHAQIFRRQSSEASRFDYYITGRVPGKTFVNDELLMNGSSRELIPGDVIQFGNDAKNTFKIKQRHVSARNPNVEFDQKMAFA